MDLTVQNVYGLLLRSGLLPPEEARALYARWQEEARGDAGNPARFSAWMVANKYVTEYQASLLARGHADGFFLGEYKILERIGKGRMAGVYRARHRLGQVVAVKVLPPSKAADPTLLARFRREAKLALKLKHPNIVRAFQLGTAGDLHYLVMEHLEGETLEDVLHRRKQLPAPEAVRLVYQALLGLEHIHEQGLVHRDLKPANLMLVPAPPADTTLCCTVKILDIGLGRALFEEGERPAGVELTVEGALLGTPDYMAPEQARDPRTADIRADIYSLGCVLYHLLAGRPPFPDTNLISQMIRHASETPRPLREFNPAVPDGLQQIVGWMLAKDPAGRYPTPARAAQALEVFLAAGSAPPSSPDHDPGMRSYLTWLEGEKPAEAPPASGAALAATVTLPAAPARPGGKPALPPPPPARDGEAHRKKKKKPAPAAGAPLIDVELVPLPPPPPAPPARPARRPAEGVTRRDLIMFFAGVGSALLAVAIGRGLAALFSSSRGKDPDDTPNDTPPSE